MRRTKGTASVSLFVSAAVAAALVLSACGSNVPPGKFVGDNGGVFGGGAVANSPGAPTSSATATAGPNSGGGSGLTNPTGGSTGQAGSTGHAGTTGQAGSDHGGSSSGSGASAGITAGSCAGMQNGHGVTSSTITLDNVADLSGPVPGLFTSAQQAARAYVAYFNQTSSICGRKLRLNNLDSQTSTNGDQEAATTACDTAFAMVGSMGAFDSGGAQAVASCGIPDLRAITTTTPRAKSPVTFGTDSVTVPLIPASPFTYLKSITGDAYKHAAMLYLNAGAAIPNGKSFKKADELLGFHFDYTQPIEVTTFNYAPYVARMASAGVKWVQYTGAYQYAVKIKQAMDTQGFHPIFVMDSVAYDPQFATSGGDAVEGTYAFVDTALFEEAAQNPEMQTYLKWLHQVSPGAAPSFFGMFAWGAMKLFAQLAVQLGGKLTRASLLNAIRGTHSYTANGLFAAQDVGGKQTSPCQVVIQLVHGKWVRKTKSPYVCGPMLNTGVS